MQTLVLNNTWQADRIVTWQDAMRLLVSGRAEAIEYYDTVVRTVREMFSVPSIIRMIGGRYRKNSTARLTKRNVWYRDNGCCQYCGKAVQLSEMTYDHVQPRSRGGKTTWDNIVTACVACNQKKGARNIRETGMVLKSVPKVPKSEIIFMNIALITAAGNKTWQQYLTLS